MSSGFSQWGDFFNISDDVLMKEDVVGLSPPGFFRLSRRADHDALDEAQGKSRGRMVSAETYWGKLMLEAKAGREVVLPNVDCCTAWCVVKQGMKAKPMREREGSPVFGPALESWALIVPESWARKYVQPYFEMNLAGEMGGVSLLEYLVTFGGIGVAVARAGATRYSHPRKSDKLLLDTRDVTGLRAAADGRAEALLGDAP